MVDPPKRSYSGGHRLLPASRPNSAAFEHIPRVPTYTLITWTFGRGSVIWRIWPAVALHTTFAACISVLCIQGILHLEIPSVMLTVLGVVIGFVISYRAMSGYERYWLGRGYWSDIVKHSRTLGRLIWFHVPPCLSPKTPEEVKSGKTLRSVKEMNKVMAEKTMALDLIYGFALAVKHHLRGEAGIYYEDLYHLVRPLHDHEHTADNDRVHASSSALPPPRRGHRITTQVNAAEAGIPAVNTIPPTPLSDATFQQSNHQLPAPSCDPVIPPINAYGTFDPSTATIRSRSAPMSRTPSRQGPTPRSDSPSSHLSESSAGPGQPLLPSSQPPSQDPMNKVSTDLIPFVGLFGRIKRGLGFGRRNQQSSEDSNATQSPSGFDDAYVTKRRWAGPVQGGMHMKHHPKVAGDGENLPLEIIRCLSEWLSVLEDRGVVPGSSMGTMVGTMAAFEDSLTGLERILTTPLPFVYAVHIRHTVWVYLFFLPFQLINNFGYYTIPGVAIAAFIYLGFVAAGEEIEQPFGYDDNDLDLDLFCKRIIGVDINHLKTSPALNAYLGPLDKDPQVIHRRSSTLDEITSSSVSVVDSDIPHPVPTQSHTSASPGLGAVEATTSRTLVAHAADV